MNYKVVHDTLTDDIVIDFHPDCKNNNWSGGDGVVFGFDFVRVTLFPYKDGGNIVVKIKCTEKINKDEAFLRVNKMLHGVDPAILMNKVVRLINSVYIAEIKCKLLSLQSNILSIFPTK